MVKDASDLLGIENSTVLADTGYYNGVEIKRCMDDGMKVYIKKQERITQLKTTNFVKKSLCMIKNKMYIFAHQAIHYPSLKIHLRMG